MSEDKLYISSIKIDLTDENWKENLIKEFESVKKNYKKIEVIVSGSVEEKASDTGINMNLVNTIAARQDLPTYVILDFLNAEGSIKRNSFKEDVLNG